MNKLTLGEIYFLLRKSLQSQTLRSVRIGAVLTKQEAQSKMFVVPQLEGPAYCAVDSAA